MNSNSSSNSCSNPSTPTSSHSTTPFSNPNHSSQSPNWGGSAFSNVFPTTPHASPNIGRSPLNYASLSQSYSQSQGDILYYDLDSQNVPNTQVRSNLYGNFMQVPIEARPRQVQAPPSQGPPNQASPQLPPPRVQAPPPQAPPPQVETSTQPPTQAAASSRRNRGKAPQNQEDEEVVVVAKRKGNFSPEEDELLVKAWMAVSEDPIVGRDQKRGAFWERIAEYYNERSSQGEVRTGRALESRFRVVQGFINHFHAIMSKVETENQSGKNNLDKYVLAKGRFRKETQKEFIWQSAFDFVRDKPRWKSATAALEHKEALQRAQNRSGQGVVEVDDNGDEVVLVDKMGKTMGRTKSKALKALAEANVKPLEETTSVMKSFLEGFNEDKVEKKEDNKKKMMFLQEASEMNKELLRKRERAVLAREKIAETLSSQETRKKQQSDLAILKEEPDSVTDEKRRNAIKKLQDSIIDYYN